MKQNIESIIKRVDGWYLNVPDLIEPVFVKNQPDAEYLFQETYGPPCVMHYNYPIAVDYELDCIMSDWPVAILYL